MRLPLMFPANTVRIFSEALSSITTLMLTLILFRVTCALKPVGHLWLGTEVSTATLLWRISFQSFIGVLTSFWIITWLTGIRNYQFCSPPHSKVSPLWLVASPCLLMLNRISTRMWAFPPFESGCLRDSGTLWCSVSMCVVKLVTLKKWSYTYFVLWSNTSY